MSADRRFLQTVAEVVGLVIALGGVQTVGAGDGAGAFLNAGLGVISAAMGGAHVAVPGDPYAAYWNPGKLAVGGRFGLAGEALMLTGPARGEDDFGARGSLGLLLPLASRFAAGLAWAGMGVGDIELRDAQGVERGRASYAENAFIGGLGVSFGEGVVGIGVALRVLRSELSADALSAYEVPSVSSPWGIAFGLHAQVWDGFWAGATVSGGSRMKWSTTEDSRTHVVSRTGATGVCFRPSPWSLVAVDLRKTHGRPLALNAGLRTRLFGHGGVVWGAPPGSSELSLMCGLSNAYLGLMGDDEPDYDLGRWNSSDRALSLGLSFSTEVGGRQVEIAASANEFSEIARRRVGAGFSW